MSSHSDILRSFVLEKHIFERKHRSFNTDADNKSNPIRHHCSGYRIKSLKINMNNGHVEYRYYNASTI